MLFLGVNMKERRYFRKYFIIGLICVLVLASVPIAIGENIVAETNKCDEEKLESSNTFHFSNCLLLVTGNVDIVTGPLVWLLGVYCPLLKRNFNILASNREGESLNVFIFGQGLQLGTYLDQEHIFIDINGARGLLYWAGKSWTNPGSAINLICKVNNLWITTYN